MFVFLRRTYGAVISSPRKYGNVERTGWFFGGMRAFALVLPFLDAGSKPMAYWAGEEIHINTLEPAEYKKLSETGMVEVREFVK